MENFVDSDFIKNLSIVLYRYRVEHETPRKQLAVEIGLSLNSITSIENGKTIPSLQTLYKYSKYYNTTISRIIERAESYE